MLYRFNIELSNVDRSVYETLDFRTALHPSETLTYLLSRVLAYALSYQEGLEFAPAGLHDPEAPALQSPGPHGSVDLWIEIGNPSSRKLHKASKTAKHVIVYTYKNPEVLLEDIKNNDVHRADKIKIHAFDSEFLQDLAKLLEKNNKWSLLFQQGQLDLNTSQKSLTTEIKTYGQNK